MSFWTYLFGLSMTRILMVVTIGLLIWCIWWTDSSDDRWIAGTTVLTLWFICLLGNWKSWVFKYDRGRKLPPQ